MAKCFCGFDHSKKMSKERQLLADAYHDLFQRATPDKVWMESVRNLQDVEEEPTGAICEHGIPTFRACALCGDTQY